MFFKLNIKLMNNDPNFTYTLIMPQLSGVI